MIFTNRIADADLLQQEINRHLPLREDTLTRLREHCRIGLTWTSNALEGNSLTEAETRAIVSDGIAIGGKRVRDHLEAIGHAEAVDRAQALVPCREITERDILQLHRLFYYRIDDASAGCYRTGNITVPGTGYVFPSPEELRELMEAFTGEISLLRSGKHPVEFAALLHTRLVTIHPFADGSGRIARLLMNLALLQEGYPMTVIPPMLRTEYLVAVKESNTGNVTPFVNLLSFMVCESQREYLRQVRFLEGQAG